MSAEENLTPTWKLVGALILLLLSALCVVGLLSTLYFALLGPVRG